jgi:hypothetical protein
MVAKASAAPPTWSFSRASLSVDAKAATIDAGPAPATSAFLPGLALSYSATSQLSLAGTYERDFPTHLSLGQLGMRFLVFKSDRGQVAGGVNAVFYADEGAAGYAKPTSWNAGVYGSWAAARAKNGQTILWAIASAARDTDNDLTMVRVGLRLQVLGGHPWIEPTPSL